MASDLVQQIAQHLIAPLRTQLTNVVARAVVKLVNDGKKMQILQLELLEDETRDDCERVQNYGFTSVPEDGAEAVALFPGGGRDHGLVIAVDDRRYRLKGLAKGEVAVYDKQGSKIVLKSNGDIEITASGDVKFNGGSTPVAKEGSGTTGHQHTLAGTAGPYPLSGTAAMTTDSIATGAGSSEVKVP